MRKINQLLMVLFLTICACVNRNPVRVEVIPTHEQDTAKDTVKENFLKTSPLDSLLADKFINYEWDSLSYGKQRFTELFITYLKNKELFLDELPLLEKVGVSITSPASGRVKMYSYDDWTGGSWHNHKTFIQYMDENEKLKYREWIINNGNASLFKIVGSFQSQGEEYCIIEEWNKISGMERYRAFWVTTIDNFGMMKPTLRYFPLEQLEGGGIWKIDRKKKYIYCTYPPVFVREDGISREVVFVKFNPETFSFTHSEAHRKQFETHKYWRLINIDDE